jgi:hypothetical protein
MVLWMNTLLQNVGDLNDMLLQGKDLEALERFYDDEVEVQENDRQPLKGKERAIQAKKDFLSQVSEVRSVKPLKVAVGEKTTMVEWHLAYQLREGSEREFTQVAVQEWEAGRIVREKFYFGGTLD